MRHVDEGDKPDKNIVFFPSFLSPFSIKNIFIIEKAGEKMGLGFPLQWTDCYESLCTLQCSDVFSINI